MRKNTFFFSFLFLFFFSAVQAQFQASWLSDNYAGVNSLTFNPASPASFPLGWDLNLGSAEVFAANNYGYISSRSLYDFYKNRNQLEVLLGPDLEDLILDVDFVFDFFEGKRLRSGSIHANILGPSFSIKLNKNHQVGFFTSARTVFGTRKIPGNLSYYTFSSFPYNQGLKLKPFSLTAMSWGEAGINYVFTKKMPLGDLSIGINAKLLQGFEVFYMGTQSNIEITRIEPDTIAGNSPNLHFGYASSLINSLPEVSPEVNGSGLGLDIGVVYKNDSKNSDKLYDYKIGVSVMNLGAINFNKNAFDHVVQANGVRQIAWKDYKDFQGLSSLKDVITQFSYNTLGDSLASLQSSEIRTVLPATLNIFGDFSLMPNVFVNASLVQPMLSGKVQPQIASSLSVTPRFEHRWLGAYLPLTLTDWQQLDIGFAARLGYLIIGTENLGSLFASGNLSGAEAFVGLKFNPFKVFSDDKHRGRSVKGIQCYKF